MDRGEFIMLYNILLSHAISLKCQPCESMTAATTACEGLLPCFRLAKVAPRVISD